MTFRQAFRFTETDDLRQHIRELNVFLDRLQAGGLVQYGLKMDNQTRSAAPADPPGTGDPNLVMVDVAGTFTLFIWDGAAWSVV